MSIKKIYRALGAVVITILIGLVSTIAVSQMVSPVGKTTEQASQLIFWYDSEGSGGDPFTDRDTAIQVVNASVDTPTWVHVQIFASSNPEPGNPNTAVLCRETNFNDFYTPNDMHVYFMSQVFTNDPSNVVFVGGFNGTKGFVVITPIDAPGTRNAIAHKHMFGRTFVTDIVNLGIGYQLNATGRDAVDSSGALVADGTVLDGTSNAYELLQPRFLEFNFHEIMQGPFENFADVISIVFSDNYDGPFGYVAEPGDATWTPLIFDEFENPVSCSPVPHFCFMDIGLNGDGVFGFVPADELLTGEQVLCPGNPNFRGWVKIGVSGLSNPENNIGIVAITNEYVTNQIIISPTPTPFDFGGASWMIGK
ncbi:MAG: hypothetical protein IH874_02715 [Candidatus Dadabacteria bacterium]|nr:hypothetical protein [Candidatus Dadabacteria bacterium]